MLGSSPSSRSRASVSRSTTTATRTASNGCASSRALMAGERVTFQGRYFQLDDYSLRPLSRRRSRPHIYAGGESEPARVQGRGARGHLAHQRTPARRRGTDGRGRREEAAFRRAARIRGRPASSWPAAPKRKRSRCSTRSIARRASAPRKKPRSGRSASTPRPRPSTSAKKYADKAPDWCQRRRAPGLRRQLRASRARRFADFHAIGVSTFLLSFFPLIEEQERFASEFIPRVRALSASTPAQDLHSGAA